MSSVNSVPRTDYVTAAGFDSDARSTPAPVTTTPPFVPPRLFDVIDLNGSNASGAATAATQSIDSPRGFFGSIASKLGDWFEPVGGLIDRVKTQLDPIREFLKPIRAVGQAIQSGNVGEILKNVASTVLDRYFPGAGKLVDSAWGALKGIGKSLQSLFGGKPRTNVEQERWQKLQEAGYRYVPNGAADPNAKTYVPKGQLIRPDLAPDFVGVDARSGQWVNNRFSQSRNEADLTGKDIWGYAVWAEKFGNRWMEVPPQARERIAEEALRLGLVREHHGTIDVRFSPELESFSRRALGLESTPVR